MDETDPFKLKVFDNYVNRVNYLIQSGSALCYGLRKFEVFLFDE